jgi:hypothetical protein
VTVTARESQRPGRGVPVTAAAAAATKAGRGRW